MEESMTRITRSPGADGWQPVRPSWSPSLDLRQDLKMVGEHNDQLHGLVHVQTYQKIWG